MGKDRDGWSVRPATRQTRAERRASTGGGFKRDVIPGSSGLPADHEIGSGGNGAFLELSKVPSPDSKGLRGLLPPPTPGKSVKNPDAKRARRCTMEFHSPAAGPGEVIWKMSVERIEHGTQAYCQPTNGPFR